VEENLSRNIWDLISKFDIFLRESCLEWSNQKNFQYIILLLYLLHYEQQV